MVQKKHQTEPAHRRRMGFLLTTLWMVPAMAATGACGFLLARYILPSRVLKESKIQHEKLNPVRILNPNESEKLSNDKTSHVWTEGVQESDLPKAEPGSTLPRRKRPTTRPPKSAPTNVPSTAAPDTPLDNDDNSNNAPGTDDYNPPPDYNGVNE